MRSDDDKEKICKSVICFNHLFCYSGTASRLMVYLQIIVLIVPIVQISVTSGFIVDDLGRSQYNSLLVIECYGRVDIVKY